jgi:hypothetical protein
MFWLLLLVVAILLFGAAAVRGFLGTVGIWIIGVLFVTLVFATFKYFLPEADAFDFSMLILGIVVVGVVARIFFEASDGIKKEKYERSSAERKRVAEEAAVARQKEMWKLNPKLRPRKSLEESYKRKKS